VKVPLPAEGAIANHGEAPCAAELFRCVGRSEATRIGTPHVPSGWWKITPKFSTIQNTTNSSACRCSTLSDAARSAGAMAMPRHRT